MIYDLIAPLYDEVNKDIDYRAWADFIEEIIKSNYSDKKPELALDLGSGTGKMTLELAKRGYDMTGIDISVEMLDIARKEAEKQGIQDRILWLYQDISEFELYGTVEFAVSCLDTVNHLTDINSLNKCFALVHNYLVPGGLFIFDINGRNKFESVYADNSFVIENKKSFCVWQNYYNARNHICDFYITLFNKDSNGTYTRYDEIQSERMYTVRSIKNSLKRAGFDFIGAYSDFNFNTADDSDERIYIVAKCLK